MKKYLKIFGVFLAVISITSYYSCETTELDLISDPNNLPLEAANPDLLLNGVQTAFADLIQSLGTAASEVSRLEYMYGRNYQNAYSPAYFNSEWRMAYVGVLKNIRVMAPIAEAKNLKKHTAMGQVMEAYTMVTLVDMFGDVPYSEAIDPANLNPKLDSGAEIYTKALTLLDQAIVNFNATTTVVPATDFYYNRNWTKWVKLANTIKMKIYLQRRKVDNTAIASFNAIVTAGSFMVAGDDFEFNWGTSNSNPDSRHPNYSLNYTPSGDNGGYEANWLMNVMKNGKSIRDPRMRYYFYRQVSVVVQNEQDTRCSVEPIPAHYFTGGHTYCIIANDQGYWGRDHGSNEGIPNDRAKRTATGLYPAGGRFDGNNAAPIASLTLGARGNGITPILLVSTVDFWRAEAALSLGGTGDARALMLAGIQKSFTKVRGFISRDATAVLAFVPALGDDTIYMNEAGVAYDASPVKMNVVIKEMFVTLYGNGIDAYNAYRRTGYPLDMQPNVDPLPGGYIRSFFYPASEVSTNASVAQKSGVTTRVFWDNNPTTGFPVGN